MISVIVLLLLVVSIPLLADGERKRSMLYSYGVGTSDLDARVFDFGFEVQIAGNFYGQFLAEYSNESFEEFDAYSSKGWGFNLFGLYKFPVSEKVNLFAKAGVNYTHMELEVEKDEDGAYPPGINDNLPNLGIGIGAGVELQVTDHIAIHGGATYKVLFDSEPLKWLKCYAGFSYGVK